MKFGQLLKRTRRERPNHPPPRRSYWDSGSLLEVYQKWIVPQSSSFLTGAPVTDAVGLRRCSRVLRRLRRPGEINSRPTIDSFGSPIPTPPKPTLHLGDLGTRKAPPVNQLIHKLIENKLDDPPTSINLSNETESIWHQSAHYKQFWQSYPASQGKMGRL